jgi:cell division septation protein DedD
MRKSHIGLIAMLTAVMIVIAGCSRVGEDWKAAQAADTTEAYQDFLRQHPDSEFGVPAQERLKQLAEDRDWQAAAKADTLDAYQQFVATHADGKWAQEARVRIENFQLTAGGQPAAGTAAAAGMPGATPSPGTTAAPGKTAPTVKSPSAPAATAAAPVTPKPTVKPTVKPAAKSAAKSTGKTTGAHYVQLGAFASKASAETAWHKLSGRFPGQLKSLQPHYAAATSHGKPIVRLQVALPSSQRAHELCTELKQHSQACLPVG